MNEFDSQVIAYLPEKVMLGICGGCGSRHATHLAKKAGWKQREWRMPLEYTQ